MGAQRHPPYGETIFESTDSILIEATDSDASVAPSDPMWTAAHLLNLMRARIKFYGSPLPEGFVPPPGIDLNDLLKQVPWPPPSAEPPTA
jgi:hypothetical protein